MKFETLILNIIIYSTQVQFLFFLNKKYLVNIIWVIEIKQF